MSISSYSSLKRSWKSTPTESWLGFDDPAPTPAVNRSLVRARSVRNRWARSTGWRSGTMKIEVPISMLVVAAAAGSSHSSGSGRITPGIRLSWIHTPSRPACSTMAARAAMPAASSGRSSPSLNGMLIPIRTLAPSC